MGTAERQGELWGAAPEEWAEYNEPTGAPLYEAGLDALGATTGTRLLDAGCGAGLALQLAARRGATVAGFDASAGLLSVARTRVPDADLRQGDLEALPWDDGTFDAVAAFNSVQYAGDPVAALREIRRVAIAGAPVVVASWGDPERCEARVLLGAVGSLLPPPPPGTGGPFALAAPGALEALVESAGLTARSAVEVDTPFVWADHDVAVRAALSSGPARAAIDQAGAEAVADAAGRALGQFVQSDGSVRLANVMRFVLCTA